MVYTLKIVVTLLCLFRFSVECIGALKFDHVSFETEALLGQKTVEFEFPFTVRGEGSVEIAELKTSCGCTTAKLQKKSYALGERGSIKGRFSIGNRLGLQKKVVTVKTNWGDHLLTVSVFIPQILKIEPGLLVWRKGEMASEQSLEIYVEPSSNVEIELVSFESEDFVLKEEQAGEVKGLLSFSVSPRDTESKYIGRLRIDYVVNNNRETRYSYAMVK